MTRNQISAKIDVHNARKPSHVAKNQNTSRKRSNENESQLGVSDLPTQPGELNSIGELDELGLESYYRGLATFVDRCVTPMTIAIQGQWGSGKTSALHNIKTLLPGDIKVVYVDTWQYSLFGHDEGLVFSVLNKILDTFMESVDVSDSMNDTERADFNEALRKVFSTIQTLGFSVVQGMSMAHGFDAEAAQEYLRNSNRVSNLEEEQMRRRLMDQHEELVKLRARIETLVSEYCRINGSRKVVFLVDDMDRLEPRKAIELLEVFKVLLDVKKTTFVLALDFEVVVTGLSDRFGGESGGGISLTKARSFFDKIVQVPFNMPISSYQPRKLIAGQLSNLGLGVENKTVVDKYAEAVRWSVGNNPRSIKRLFNRFTLTQVIRNDQMSAARDEKLTLPIFLLICLELAYPLVHEDLALYAELLENGNDIPEKTALTFRTLLVGSDEEEVDLDQLKRWEIGPELFDDFKAFSYQLQAEFGKDSSVPDSAESDAQSMPTLVRALRLSSVTSVEKKPSGSSEAPGESSIVEKLKFQGFETDEGHPDRALILHLQDRIDQLVATYPEIYDKGIVLGPVMPKASPNYSGFLAKSLEDIQSLYSRSRPKFLDVRQNKRSLVIGFGVRTKDLSTVLGSSSEEEGLVRADNHSFIDDETAKSMVDTPWAAVIDALSEELPNLDEMVDDREGDPLGYSFSMGMAPIVVKGIRSVDDVDTFMNILPAIYKAATAHKNRTFRK